MAFAPRTEKEKATGNSRDYRREADRCIWRLAWPAILPIPAGSFLVSSFVLSGLLIGPLAWDA